MKTSPYEVSQNKYKLIEKECKEKMPNLTDSRDALAFECGFMEGYLQTKLYEIELLNERVRLLDEQVDELLSRLP